MEITAEMVRTLRERTSSGIMECKKALKETNGDIEAAIEHMRKTGIVKADKKAGRIAADGVIVAAVSEDNKLGYLIEINSETDFVAKSDDFTNFTQQVAKLAVSHKVETVDVLAELDAGNGETVDHIRKALIAKIGENIQIRRLASLAGDNLNIGYYIHGGRIGALVAMENGNDALIKDVAMHIAASKTLLALDETGVPQDTLEKEKEILMAQVKDSGKPQDIVEKMVQGRLKKFLAEVTLVNQPFVKDPDQTVGKLVESKGAKLHGFYRFEVGEGIEKAQVDFAEEVQAQVRAAQSKD